MRPWDIAAENGLRRPRCRWCVARQSPIPAPHSRRLRGTVDLKEAPMLLKPFVLLTLCFRSRWLPGAATPPLRFRPRVGDEEQFGARPGLSSVGRLLPLRS